MFTRKQTTRASAFPDPQIRRIGLADNLIAEIRMDTSTSTGRLMLNVLGAVAQFEREVMLERQREGIEKAKAAGKYRGHAPTARAKADEVIALKRQGVGASEIARKLGIGRASVNRILTKAA